jgi:hypothetical protein
MEVEMDEPDAWQALLDTIHEECLRVGSWSGEVRLLRDAIGATRMGPRVVDRIRTRLAEAGYEIEGDSQAEGSLAYESLWASIAPTGARELAATVESLLPEIRRWDAAIADPPWRDHLVAIYSAGRWLEARRSPPRRSPGRRDE